MRIWPVILDSRPNVFGSTESLRTGERPGDGCLNFLPLGTSTVLEHVAAAFEPITGNPPLVVPPEDAGLGYSERVQALIPSARVVDTLEKLALELSAHELSDAILIVDPRYMPLRGLQLSDVVHHYTVEPRVCHHLVAFQSSVAGTKERISLDTSGQVRSIQRFYQQATWPFVSGILATLVPCACEIHPNEIARRSLLGLRQLLAARGVPSRDVPIEGAVVDLTEERGILTVNERFVHSVIGAHPMTDARGVVYIGDGHKVHPSARLIGPIILHRGVQIGENATVVGPVVLGTGVKVEAGAVVAHAVVSADSVVKAAAVVRDRAWFGEGARQTPVSSYPETLARLAHDARSVADEDGWSTGTHWYTGLKRAIDAAMAALSLSMLSPLFAVVAAAIWLESGGPVFYGDKREGRSGRVFRCWKFRTMYTGAHLDQPALTALDHTDGPHFKIDRDPRVTRVGRILRMLNLDEVPQLINVILGEMSLIGPRPSPFRENQICVPWREARLSVRPGITGFWQVCRHNRTEGDFHQWIEYDLLYVQHLSLWLDAKILVATILTLGGKASHVPADWLVGARASRAEAQSGAASNRNERSGSRAAQRQSAPRALTEL